MTDSLSAYLRDHLSGSRAAIDLLEHLRDRSGETGLGEFAAALLVDVRRDRVTLQEIAARAGGSRRAHPFKEALAWAGEKAARLELARGDPGLARLRALEALSLGIFGKASLWRAMAHAVSEDPRFRGVDFGSLIARAEEQRARVEERRLAAAREACGAASTLRAS